jgi:DNA-binding CsgD family transcriptional regulator
MKPSSKHDLIHQSPAMVFIADMDTRNIQWCNKTMENILGYSLDEMQQMGDTLFQTIMHPEDYPNASRARDLFLKGKVKYNAICRFQRKNDMKYLWFYGTSEAYHYNGSDNLKTIFCTFLELDETDTPAQIKALLNALLRKSMKERLERLTVAEEEILPLIAQGLNNREIAKEHYKSFYTIETHVKHIKMKLDLHSRAELIAFLKRIGY